MLPCWEFCHRCEHFSDVGDAVDCELRPIPTERFDPNEETPHPCPEWKWRRHTKEELEAIVKIVRESETPEM